MIEGMMKRLTLPKWASVAALAATTLFANPTAFADVSQKPQIKNQHNSGHSNSRDRGHDIALRECGSSGYRTNTCHFRVGFDIVDAIVDDRKSNARCDRGTDWGLRGNSIWVRDGCRAIFKLSSARLTSHYDDRNRRDVGHDAQRDYGYTPNHHREISYRDEVSAIGTCAREANHYAYKRDLYSAQYTYEPRVEVGHKGRLRVTGAMRVHGPHGFRNKRTLCEVDRSGRVRNFEFSR